MDNRAGSSGEGVRPCPGFAPERVCRPRPTPCRESPVGVDSIVAERQRRAPGEGVGQRLATLRRGCARGCARPSAPGPSSRPGPRRSVGRAPPCHSRRAPRGTTPGPTCRGAPGARGDDHPDLSAPRVARACRPERTGPDGRATTSSSWSTTGRACRRCPWTSASWPSRSHATSGRAGVVRNVGIALSRSTYLAFLDDDNEWRPHHLAAALDALSAGVDLVYTGVERVHPDGTCSTCWRAVRPASARRAGRRRHNSIVVRRAPGVRFSRLPRSSPTMPRGGLGARVAPQPPRRVRACPRVDRHLPREPRQLLHELVCRCGRGHDDDRARR